MQLELQELEETEAVDAAPEAKISTARKRKAPKASGTRCKKRRTAKRRKKKTTQKTRRRRPKTVTMVKMAADGTKVVVKKRRRRRKIKCRKTSKQKVCC